MNRRYLISLLLILSIMAVPLTARTIWRDKNLYSSADVLQIGDIIQVNIVDISNLRFSLTLTSETNSDLTSNPDITITGFLPKVSSSKKSVNNDNTQFNGRGQIDMSIAARLTRREGRGYRINGTRIYSFSGVTNTFSISGIIDPAMVQGRVIESSNVLNFQLVIRGRKEGAVNIEREKLKEEESSKVTLTEEEKQQIITDYLNKMLNEMTR